MHTFCPSLMWRDHAPWTCVLSSVFNVNYVLGFGSEIPPTYASILEPHLLTLVWETVGILRSGAWLVEVGY